MSDKKIIAVLGATGRQGGGLVRAVVDDPDGPFAVRAITRRPDSRGARDLAGRGADVVQATVDDPQALRTAFAGAYGAYVVTNFFESMSAEVEKAQAATAAQAAKVAGVAHVIWSTLEDTRRALADTGVPALQGDYTVPHFDAKNDADEYFRDLRVPTTFLRSTFYWEAFLDGLGPRRADDGTLELTLPMGRKRLAGIASEDIGRTAYGIFQRGTETIGETVSIAGEHLTGQQYAEAFTRVLGRTVHYRPMTIEQFGNLGEPTSHEFAHMFRFYQLAEAEFVGDRDLSRVRALNPRLQSFAQWLDRHRDAFGDS
ncbi:NmrA/HSCARG family protein [Streptomyces sp. NPDC089424]|uniref:NmrA/HSCARG family protein n=1 Tax=Streptomyces sp. NPDC089424 TaxID=3365917 RepID=UPI003805172A